MSVHLPSYPPPLLLYYHGFFVITLQVDLVAWLAESWIHGLGGRLWDDKVIFSAA